MKNVIEYLIHWKKGNEIGFIFRLNIKYAWKWTILTCVTYSFCAINCKREPIEFYAVKIQKLKRISRYLRNQKGSTRTSGVSVDCNKKNKIPSNFLMFMRIFVPISKIGMFLFFFFPRGITILVETMVNCWRR